MSFSSAAKDELTRIRLKGEAQRRALLCAFVGSIGSVTLGRGALGVRCVTESLASARFFAQLAAGEYGVDASIAVNQHQRLNARTVAVTLSGEGCKSLLIDAGVLSPDGSLMLGSGPHAALTRGEALDRVYLRGVFLACGSVSNPRKGYHLELVCRSETMCRALLPLMEEYGLGGKAVERNGSFVIYIKGSEQIASFLAFVGASGAILELESAMVIKDVRNRANRVSNCEVGNMGKIALAAARQSVAIEALKIDGRLDKLPPALREAAELRMNYPVASLTELAEMAGVSRSVMNRRLIAVEEQAKER